MKAYLVIFDGLKRVKRATYRSSGDIKARFFPDMVGLMGKEWTEIHVSIFRDLVKLPRRKSEKKTKKG
jgi:hypothetical protein